MGYGDISGSMWYRYQYGAQDRGLDFRISIQEAWTLFKKQNGKCAFSGIDIYFGKRVTKDETTASLDRKDSSKGYTLDNVQWVHKEINRMKGQLSDTELRTWCTLIATH
jgi:hypothetical protein